MPLERPRLSGGRPVIETGLQGPPACRQWRAGTGGGSLDAVSREDSQLSVSRDKRNASLAGGPDADVPSTDRVLVAAGHPPICPSISPFIVVVVVAAAAAAAPSASEPRRPVFLAGDWHAGLAQRAAIFFRRLPGITGWRC
ncbi:hypothetical protein PCL_13055 [Purpureocillium lilacinum]|uniref:Uncharacterized protein n=1 Tax=Purpureocillium lilacinum TaxID=33203 RepID=A0A2U3E843_PURLI|nr:hypothetical protein PCL_13055 [Purpureocillium lilacinum]